jgi:multicomponent Na+:H+ antiporter subunit D
VRARTLLPAGILLLTSLAIFVVPGPLWELCLQAADGLLDVGPYVEAVTGS